MWHVHSSLRTLPHGWCYGSPTQSNRNYCTIGWYAPTVPFPRLPRGSQAQEMRFVVLLLLSGKGLEGEQIRFQPAHGQTSEANVRDYSCLRIFCTNYTLRDWPVGAVVLDAIDEMSLPQSLSVPKTSTRCGCSRETCALARGRTHNANMGKFMIVIY